MTRQESIIMQGQNVKQGWSMVWSKLGTGKSAKSNRRLKQESSGKKEEG